MTETVYINQQRFFPPPPSTHHGIGKSSQRPYSRGYVQTDHDSRPKIRQYIVSVHEPLVALTPPLPAQQIEIADLRQECADLKHANAGIERQVREQVL